MTDSGFKPRTAKEDFACIREVNNHKKVGAAFVAEKNFDLAIKEYDEVSVNVMHKT